MLVGTQHKSWDNADCCKASRSVCKFGSPMFILFESLTKFLKCPFKCLCPRITAATSEEDVPPIGTGGSPHYKCLPLITELCI